MYSSTRTAVGFGFICSTKPAVAAAVTIVPQRKSLKAITRYQVYGSRLRTIAEVVHSTVFNLDSSLTSLTTKQACVLHCMYTAVQARQVTPRRGRYLVTCYLLLLWKPAPYDEGAEACV